MILVHTTWAKIGIQTNNAALSIRQPCGQQSLEHRDVRMFVEREPTVVQIDQSACFAEAGLKNALELSRENAEMGRMAVLEGIARRADEGNMLAGIETGVSAIAEIAAQNLDTAKDFTIAFIPQSRPTINITGSFYLRWEIGGVDANYQPRYPEIEYTPGNVGIYLRQQGDIEIHYVDEKV